jgi:hypothetical protein
MTRYFFDRVTSQHSQYDYQGKMLDNPERARQHAELLAMDLGMEPDEGWSGWSVNVRNPEGLQLFSVPVRSVAIAA